MNHTKTVIFDLDGTLADVSHRRHFVTDIPKDFDSFYKEMGQDKAFLLIIELCNMYFESGWHVVICTGRPEKFREMTTTWLRENLVQYELLLMRENSRWYDKDMLVKKDMLEFLKSLGYNPTLAVDDRKQVVDMWRESGLICLQVADGNF